MLGVNPARIAIDPGIGFGKKDPHNLLLLQELAAFQVFACPVLLGVSRKSFVGRLSRKEPPRTASPAPRGEAWRASTKASRSSASTTWPRPTRPGRSGWRWGSRRAAGSAAAARKPPF